MPDQTYFNGLITVRKRPSDWMAFVTGDEKIWDCGPSPEAAIGGLVMNPTTAGVLGAARLKTFRIYWLGGKIDTSQGFDIADAFRRLGYGEAAVEVIDYYEEVK